MKNPLEENVRKGIGGLAAKLLTDIIGADIADSLKPLKEGNLDSDALATIARTVKSIMPSELLCRVLKDSLSPETAEHAITLVGQGNYAGLVDYLCKSTKPSDIRSFENPYADDTKTVAKRLTGAPFYLISARSGMTASGLITSVYAYDAGGYDSGLVLEERGPGTLGRWVSSRRGGYAIPVIEAHKPGGQGYVALASGVSGSEKLAMSALTELFGLGTSDKNTHDRLYGTTLIDPQSELKIILHDKNFSSVPAGKSIKASSGSSRGAGCLGIFEYR